MKTGINLKFGNLEFHFNWLIAGCLLLAIAGLVRLGLWQLDRAQEKVALQLSFQEAAQLQATPLAEVPVAGLEFDAIQHQNRRVSFSGKYLNDRSIFMIYQTYEDQIGYEIVTPFLLSDLDLIVMVSRGWSGISSYDELAATLPRIDDTVELQGQIFVPTPAQASLTNNIREVKWPLLVRYLNIAEIAPYFQADFQQPYFQSPLFPYVVRLAQDQPGVLIRHWPVVLVDSGRNFSYALQWFAMAIAAALAGLVLSSNIVKLLQDRLKPL